MRFASTCLWCSLLLAPALAQREPCAATLPATLPLVPLTPAMAMAPSPEKVIPAPEPSTLFLVGTGLVGFALTLRHRRRSTK